jgi:transposase
MIVIGTDTHKRTHALSAVDEGTGKIRGHRQIDADEPGHLAAVKWARGLDDERVWAIEDCRQVSRRLEQALLAAGERVARVAPQRMGPDRHLTRQTRTVAQRNRTRGREENSGPAGGPPSSSSVDRSIYATRS